MVARDDLGRVIGLAPLHLAAIPFLGFESRDTLRFIGDGGDVTPEHLDVIAPPGLEREIAEAFANQIRGDPAVHVIDLRPLAENSAMRECLLRTTRKPALVRCTQDAQSPMLFLPDSTEAFLASRSHNYRKKIGEYERRSRRDLHATFRMSTTEDERRRDMASLIRLHHLRWNGHSRAFRSARYIAFHEKLSSLLLARGWLRLFSIEKSSMPVAMLYCFVYGGHYYFYQTGRDPDFTKHRVGLLITHKAILEAIKEGATVFDFLRGTEQYKYRWAEMTVSSLRLVYWKTLRAQMKGTLQDAFNSCAAPR